METFKYYKRGLGELDTSNFPEIVKQGEITVDNLDEKAFMSLLALDNYLFSVNEEFWSFKLFPVYVTGYVHHMRGDKDVFPVSQLYEILDSLEIICNNIQHESTGKIQSAHINSEIVCQNIPELRKFQNFVQFIGADSSVPKFFPGVGTCASKVREKGKVTSLEFTLLKKEWTGAVVIVDDILGGGATIQMLVDEIKKQGYNGPIYMWVAYNEGIHKSEFLEQFAGYYLGKDI